MFVFVIATVSGSAQTIRLWPKGVTAIGNTFINWRGDLPEKGGNDFIIMEQFDRDCGPTSVEMVLYYYGLLPGQRAIWDKGNIDTIHAGTFPNELSQALTKLGVPAAVRVGKNYSLLKARIRQNKPCIILLQQGLKAYHWVVVVGYDNRNRFLIADPNGYFEWWKKNKLDAYWGFRNASGHGTTGDFINAAVRTVASPYTSVVPKNPPTWKQRNQFPQAWSQMQETQITGSKRLNPLFQTEKWQHTFTFSTRPDFYAITGIIPSQIVTAAGTAKAWISGSKVVGNSIKVWGEVEYGAGTRGKLWVVVRAFRKGIKPF